MSAFEDRFRELAAAAALQTLEPEEARELRAIVESDAGKLEQLCHLEEAALHLPLLHETVEPPAGLKLRILRAVRAERRDGTGDGWSRVARWLYLDRPRFVLATVALLLVAVLGLSLHTVRLDRAVHSERRRVLDLTDSLAERERLLQVLESADIDLVALDGLDEIPQARGTVIWDPERRVALLQISSLPPLPESETYQFWVFPKEGVPTSAGLFAVDQIDRDTYLRFDAFPAGTRQALRGFLVTREPHGGSPEPGESWYLGARLP